jgi:hypothetical protein
MLVPINVIELSQPFLSYGARPVIMCAANVLLALRIAEMIKFLGEALLWRIIRFMTKLSDVSSFVVA